jgi:hypothetical protein
MAMDQVLGWLVKLLFVVMLAPFAICLVLQFALGVQVAIQPWLLLIAVVAGVAAGFSAAIVLRRRLPPTGRGRVARNTPAGQYKVKRPRGVRGRDEE